MWFGSFCVCVLFVFLSANDLYYQYQIYKTKDTRLPIKKMRKRVERTCAKKEKKIPKPPGCSFSIHSPTKKSDHPNHKNASSSNSKAPHGLSKPKLVSTSGWTTPMTPTRCPL